MVDAETYPIIDAEKYPTIDLWNALFDRINLGHNGSISVKEIRLFIRSIDGEAVQVGDFLIQYDADEDGYVSKAEWESYWNTHVGPNVTGAQ